MEQVNFTNDLSNTRLQMVTNSTLVGANLENKFKYNYFTNVYANYLQGSL